MVYEVTEPAVQIPKATPSIPAFSMRHAMKPVGVGLVSATLAVTLIALCARWSPVAEITSHFRALYALAAIAALACLSAARAWRWSIAAAALAAWHSLAVAAWYLPGPKFQFGGSELRMLTSNVNADTDGYARLLDVIAQEDPDLIFVQELSPAWAKSLEAIHGEYPHRIISARLDYFGLGFYSRYPIENAQTNDPVNSDVPIARGDVIINGRRVHIVNVHLAPPEGRALTALRYKQFVWLTEYLEAYDGPVIAAGDFNCTMWSPLYQDLVRRGGLSDARQGHGVLASWYPLPGSLNLIPIDLILGGGGIHFTGAHLTARIGSDHIPVAASLRIAE